MFKCSQECEHCPVAVGNTNIKVCCFFMLKRFINAKLIVSFDDKTENNLINLEKFVDIDNI